MNEVVGIDDPTNYRLVTQRIRRILQQGGSICLTRHAESRMRERGFDMNDVQNIIRTGAVVSHECPHGVWRWKMVGCSVDLESAGAVVAIDGDLVIITVTAE